jgi:hypothetical protein
MLNVNQITSQLAKMPDNALQQYATMHKADPYMLALTIAESNRRKEMRTAAQGAQGAMPQPKVADQAIAGMSPQQLPENVGIGALPADNMKGMAAGGIVAFDNGGEVATSPAGEFFGGIANWFGEVGDPARNPRAQLAQLQTERARAEQGIFEALTPSQKAERKAQVAAIDAQINNMQRQTTQAAPAAKPSTAAPLFKDPRRTDNAASPNFVGNKTTDTPDTKKGLGALAGASGAASQQSGLSGGAGGAGTYKPSTLAEMMKEVSPEVEKMNAEDRAAMDPFRKQFESERSDLAKRKESNKAEAILAAGLGMLSGNSRYALQNIGTGAQQGLTSLKEANRLDDAAKRALMQSEMHLAQAEMQGRKGNFQSMNQLANQARQEKQFAVSSELQKQQIAQQGQYYGAMAKAAEAKGSMDSKMLSEYRRLQELAEKHVKDNGGMAMTDAQRSAMYQEKLNEYLATNPFMQKLGAAQAAAPTAVRLAGQNYGE